MLLFYTQRSWKRWNFSIAKSQAFGRISVKCTLINVRKKIQSMKLMVIKQKKVRTHSYKLTSK